MDAIRDELWQVMTELRSIAFLVKAIDEAQGGENFLGLGLILDQQVEKREDLIEGASFEKP